MSLFLPQLKADGKLESVYMTICNVGSRKIVDADDYADAGWKIFAPNLMIVGFDADPDACVAANADFEQRDANWIEVHLPYALSDRAGEATLYITSYPGCISLYEPNHEFLGRFLDFGKYFEVQDQVQLQTTTLDTVCQDEQLETVDFLQIDVQGANLDVLKGATELLDRSVLAIQVESEFAPLYKNQALFTDIDQYLRDRGFMLFSLLEPQRKPRAEIVAEYHRGQLLWADALFLRDPLHADAPNWLKTPENILKMACIADFFNFTDYAIELLTLLTEHHSTDQLYNVADSMILALTSVLEQLPEPIDKFGFVQRLATYLSPDVRAKLDQSV